MGTRAANHATWNSATMSDDEAMSAIDVETDDNDGEYHPRGSPVPAVESSPMLGKQQRKRGRKPNPNQSIRSAREAARKANHSVIEKKRREKINHALTELRSLVPNDDNVAASNGTKDFKLEVLVRTVTHLKNLVARVAELEASAGSVSVSSESVGTVKPATRPSPSTRCKRCIDREASDLRTRSIELPPVSSILTGLPSPPSSGSLASSSPTHTDVPSLYLPVSTMGFLRSPESVSDASPRHSPHEQAQAAYSLLHMSVREAPGNRGTHQQRVVQTPGTLLDMSPSFHRRPEDNRSSGDRIHQRWGI